MNPESYPNLEFDDQHLENIMQIYESKWICKQLNNDFSVLDLGYGSGIVCKSLSAAGKEVTVVDGALEFATQASKISYHVEEFDEFRYVKGVHSLFEEFETAETFDCVIASFILEHVKEPIKLLKRCHNWSKKIIVVVGNANSLHRQIAVEMGLQKDIYALSERDHKVGHYMVYDHELLLKHLDASGWEVEKTEGFFVKPLNNARMKDWEPELIHALNRVKILPEISANIGVVCHPKRPLS